MSLIIKEDPSEYPLCPDGLHAAVLVDAVDLGTQESPWGAKHKLSLVFETQTLDEEGKPFILVKRYTWSLHEKSSLRKDLERFRGAYAWRTFRSLEVPLTFNSDLTGSDHNFFYGFYTAITRKNKDRQPEGGWYPEQALTPEEALRAYTSWSAFASFQEEVLGTIEVGKRADLTILSLDVLNIGEQNPDSLWEGEVLATIVDGRVVFEGFGE